MTAGRFDVGLALRRVVQGFWHDFAPIVLLGLAMLTLPRLLSAAVAPTSSGATILAVLSGLLAALFVTVVSHGVVARLRGDPLDAATFVARGLVASPPGYSVALLIGAGLVVAGIAGLLVAPWRLVPVVWGVAAFALVFVLPAIPAALTEQLGALPALRRGAVLIGADLARVVVVVVVVGLATLPAWLAIAALDRAPSPFSAGLWLRALVELLIAGVAATVPGVVYVGLVTDKQ